MKGGPNNPRAQKHPDGTMRQGQLVTTFGPGAMLDLLNDAVLVGGLDFWSYDRNLQIPYITEDRLRDVIAERFRHLGQELSRERPFRAPPVGNDREPSVLAGAQVVEFPQWFVCQTPTCRALQRKDHLSRKKDHYWHECSHGREGEFVPVRFVSACKRGHIQELPWISLVHDPKKAPVCPAPTLRLLEGASGDFSEIVVACQCGASFRLNQLTGGFPLGCRGERPWLGRDGREDDCTEQARLLVRTASNSYFPLVMSALSIPDPDGALLERVRGQWDILKEATREQLPTFRFIEKVRAALAGFTDTQVLGAIKAIKEGKPVASGGMRTAEYRQFVEARPEQAGDLPTVDESFFARAAKTKEPLPKGVARVVLATKLREVVAQVGFTRLEPVSADLQGEYDLGVTAAALGLTTNWLPATEVRGEGVFLELAEEAVQAWEQRPIVQERAEEFAAGYRAWAETTPHAPPFPGIRFYLLHSLSHLLLAAISLECGYAASALRERIYCGPSAKDATPMAGILLSTGTSGSEGTLGGLVEQGRALRAHLRRAWDLGKLCSNDPVCGTHSPKDDLAERFLEGAACHGCLFLAECSCERFNRYLDRALVVPTIGHPRDLAYFVERP